MRRNVRSCEEIVDTAGLTVDTPVQRLLLHRMMVAGVVETPNGAHFTTCTPDYERDEKFQRAYAAASCYSCCHVAPSPWHVVGPGDE